MTKVTIARATDAEASACLALVPEAARWPVELLAATCEGEPIGAAALAWRDEGSPAGFALDIHVIAPERRQGVGRRLFDAAVDLADGETSGFWSMRPIEANAPAAAFASAVGFSPGRREHHFETRAEAVLGLVGPIASRLRQRSRIPEDLTLVPLADAPLDQVARLMSGSADSANVATLDRLAAYARDTQGVGLDSRIALRGPHAAGAMIWRRREEVALVEMWAVDRRNRGWLSLVLLEEALSRGQAEGVRSLRFHCDERARDTMNLAALCGAREQETLDYLYCPLAGSLDRRESA
ncbi:MAG TPA: GNAT family N-acetyltransferase [Caulobacteraceae bacterium]|jgi:GNAT superfamily N-acetyltransferase|nr:GNAT family N-acetyltransferase [Caulobacteraceae bacterium]